MVGEQQTGVRVELTYVPTLEDLRQALNARTRASASARRTRWLLMVSGVLAVVVEAASLVLNGKFMVPMCVIPVIVLFMLFGLPRLQARQFYRVVAAQGRCRTVVSEQGLTVVAETASSNLTWQAMPCYVETPELFVLFSGDRNASCLTVLPKRGVNGPEDVERLRGVLDRYVRRV
ncbi:YcxB family protein [Streptomyces gamaensis]|uniref:YcxB family protein n=1 Tax=Streptomyces gamaensis TaxID=1763542 RepID=A0ABW0Z3S6_9ACTN